MKSSHWIMHVWSHSSTNVTCISLFLYVTARSIQGDATLKCRVEHVYDIIIDKSMFDNQKLK